MLFRSCLSMKEGRFVHRHGGWLAEAAGAEAPHCAARRVEPLVSDEVASTAQWQEHNRRARRELEGVLASLLKLALTFRGGAAKRGGD